MSQDKIHIMVDIETYDTKPTAVILSIGATVIEDTSYVFYSEPNTSTQWERTQSISTMEWWSNQETPTPRGTIPLYKALTTFADWIKSFNREPVIWCKGTDFDVAILANAYEQMYIPVPWKYNNIRDCRTLFKVTRTEAQKAAHNALIDAKQQTEDLLICMEQHGLVLA